MLLLDTGVLEFLKDSAVQSFYKVNLALTAGIYNLITWLYSVFTAIAKARFISNDTIAKLTGRLYLIIGIIALFLVAYSFLMVIVNPENLTKGNSSPVKMVRNILISILAMTFIPTIFNFAYAVQNSVLERNVIGKLFFSDIDVTMDTKDDNLSSFAVNMFQGSFYVIEPGLYEDADTRYENCQYNSILYHDVNFFGECIPDVIENKDRYNVLIALIVGLFTAYVLIIYCIDIALRTVKLVVLQIISPIPSLLLIIPGQDKVFKSWMKDTLKTFMEVFIKVFILVIGIYLIQLITISMSRDEGAIFPGVSGATLMFAKLFIIMGVLMFVNKAPKLLSDIFGVDLSSNGLSLKKRFNEMKEGFNTLSSPIRAAGRGADKVIGGFMGWNYANMARKKAERDNNFTSSKKKKALSGLMGFKNGFQSGIRGSGGAYKYEQLMQQSYALDSTKSENEQIMGAIRDRARGFVGRDTRYDEEIRDKAIIRDRELAKNKEDLRRIRQETGEEIKKVEKQHADTIDANKNISDKASAFMDSVKDENGKADSKIRLSNDSIIKTMLANNDADIRTTLADKSAAVAAGDMETVRQCDKKLSDLSVERKSVIDAYNYLQAQDNQRTTITTALANNDSEIRTTLANKQTALAAGDMEAVRQCDEQLSNLSEDRKRYVEAYDSLGAGLSLSDEHNRHSMEQVMKNISESDMDQNLKNAFNLVYSFGQKETDLKYLETGEENWTSKIKMNFSDLTTAIKGDVDAGYIFDSTAGPNGSRVQKVDFGSMLSDFKSITKIGKKASELVDNENMDKNKQLSETKVSVRLVDDDINNPNDPNVKTEKTLFEWNQEDKHKDEYIKEVHKDYEKFVESVKPSKEAFEKQQEAREAVKKKKPKKE